ncbi:hypothetical protein DFH08DRAFT_802291 [Mycena albidolilacea]|uniref:Uncharacterized protein n=1 Tax=Mycena albidolilacea TaxID=1033008 RepID=A0AAD7AIB8_9AGAR|nr:hypothetical protein DFH08DRAFT_802291 [Mycena albidolilacea]
MHKELERVLDPVVYAHLDGCRNAQSNYLIDDIVHDVIVRLLREYSYDLWASVPKTLSHGPSIPSHRAQHKHTPDVVGTEVLAALWRVLSTSQSNFFPTNNAPYLRSLVEVYGSALVSLSTIAPSTIARSLTGMLKALIINTLQFNIVNTSFVHHLLPTDTAILLPDDINPEALLPGARFMEAKISMVAEFLQGCRKNPICLASGSNEFQAVSRSYATTSLAAHDLGYGKQFQGTSQNRFRKAGKWSCIYRGGAHEAHQIRPGHAKASQSKAKAPRAELLATWLLQPPTIFNIYAGLPPPVQYDLSGLELVSIPPENYAWLDSLTAQAIINDVLAHVCQWPTFVWQDEAVLTCMQAIIQGLDSLHVSPASTLLSSLLASPRSTFPPEDCCCLDEFAFLDSGIDSHECNELE